MENNDKIVDRGYNEISSRYNIYRDLLNHGLYFFISQDDDIIIRIFDDYRNFPQDLFVEIIEKDANANKYEYWAQS